MTWGLGAPLVVVALLVAAWAIDVGASGGQVIRNVDLAGSGVGGLTRESLRERIESAAAALPDREVRIVTPGENPYLTTAEAIGLSVDIQATAEKALDAGRDGALPIRPFRWLGSFFASTDVSFEFTVNVQRAEVELRQLEGDALVSPVEPTIELTPGGKFQAVPGAPGAGIEPAALAVALEAAAESTPPDEPVVIEIRQTTLLPRLPDQTAKDAAALANLATGNGLEVVAGDAVATASTTDLRTWVIPVEGEDSINLTIDEDEVMAWLHETFGTVITEKSDARFDIVDGQPVLTEGVVGLECCGDESVDAVWRAIEAGEPRAEATLVETQPEFSTADALALGITTEVGSPTEFGPTTEHPCCKNRVTNIHRIADLLRGYIIEPGETLSINDYVGRRTVEKGFVSDGVIYNGVLTQDVGGGVSQFATTLFNAALFAGLEFGEYQSHSLYISRYPRGHEATISYPAPDLEIENPTPYGVLIWPTYTDTSLTVHLYSTPWAEVTVGEPRSSPQGNCTRWTTPRTRVLTSGEVLEDSVFALYRPAEGVNC